MKKNESVDPRNANTTKSRGSILHNLTEITEQIIEHPDEHIDEVPVYTNNDDSDKNDYESIVQTPE